MKMPNGRKCLKIKTHRLTKINNKKIAIQKKKDYLIWYIVTWLWVII